MRKGQKAQVPCSNGTSDKETHESDNLLHQSNSTSQANSINRLSQADTIQEEREMVLASHSIRSPNQKLGTPFPLLTEYYSSSAFHPRAATSLGKPEG